MADATHDFPCEIRLGFERPPSEAGAVFFSFARRGANDDCYKVASLT